MLVAENLGRSAIKDLGNAAGLVMITAALTPKRVLEGVARSVKFTVGACVKIAGTSKGLADLIHPATYTRQSLENRLSGRAIGREMGLPLGRYAVKLPRPFLLHARLSDLIKIGERGVDHAWTWAVEASRALFDGLDEFVAVSRPRLQKRQDHKLEVGGAELASRGKIAATAPAHEVKASVAKSVAAALTPNGVD